MAHQEPQEDEGVALAKPLPWGSLRGPEGPWSHALSRLPTGPQPGPPGGISGTGVYSLGSPSLRRGGFFQTQAGPGVGVLRAAQRGPPELWLGDCLPLDATHQVSAAVAAAAGQGCGAASCSLARWLVEPWSAVAGALPSATEVQAP